MHEEVHMPDPTSYSCSTLDSSIDSNLARRTVLAGNDVAILWPPGREPIVAAVYMSESTLPRERLEPVHASIGRLIAAEFR
jgi:hypothetical protein